MHRSKKYKESLKLIDRKKHYSVDEAIELVNKTSYSNFVGSLDLVVNFNIPSKRKNDSVRGSITLPHQMDTEKKIVVIAEKKDQKIAKEAGADEVGLDELIEKLKEGYSEFDILIATPNVMPKVASLGPVLGPKGLMPNPKNNTVTEDLEKVIKNYKAGKMNFKVDDHGSIKAKIAKLDMKKDEQKENLIAFLKKTYTETRIYGPQRLKDVILSATMGPAIKVDTSDVLKEIK
ncbi:50S ribosomal protein L1 [Candidatus Dojkabacteria bacterium]|nr:50S ribosomal protein L1 [Candidatus Dojkabacteria bacterium]